MEHLTPTSMPTQDNNNNNSQDDNQKFMLLAFVIVAYIAAGVAMAGGDLATYMLAKIFGLWQ